MPLTAPQALSNDEVYAVTAYLLHLNGIIGERDAIDAESLPWVKMPNQNNQRTKPRSEGAALTVAISSLP
jgi:S-disulfanyl-L-cysteine oxidoreductase SoxD